ncbi:fungal hydrophobin-domain-containing protein [Collybia nuda]|uniref:Hydrophobin n=1 Tax=Collybia nuda TaxID=64659 RepID=A0A9P5XRB8_9AGAR|nr:fungal hydrophobin-domain-containing protein [Collybia nuda]
MAQCHANSRQKTRLGDGPRHEPVLISRDVASDNPPHFLSSLTTYYIPFNHQKKKFHKVAILATISLALSTAAAPSGDEYKCNTGKVYCCNRTEQAQSVEGAKIIAVLGAAAQGITGTVGSGCSPITAVGAGSGASCTQKPVCCENNHMNGLVVVGCSPISLGT